MIWEYIVICFITVFILIFIYYKRSFRYWKNRNLPSLEAKIPFGTIENPCFAQKNLGIQFKEFYDKIKAHRFEHGGIYLAALPVYVPVNLQIIKCITGQHFDYFDERGFYYNEKDDPLSANLFALGGEKWKTIRTKLSPAFTSAKIKLIFDMLLQCGHQLENFVNNCCKNKQELDIKEVMACYTIDVIGSCAFGLDCNSFVQTDSEFRKHGKKIFDFSSMLRTLTILFAFSWPKFARRLGIRLLHKETADFFINVVKQTVNFRKEKKVNRKDMLQLLIELENGLQSNNDETLFEQLAAEVFVFFVAGFENSANTLSFCLYELAINMQIQEKVINEVTSVLTQYKGKITYEAIQEMKFMNQVIDETLRKHPPVSIISRKCTKDYTIPGTDTILEKGTLIIISILGLHHDAEYFPQPDKFDPERFSEENKKHRPAFTYMPFGEGPRTCIGLRFGLTQIKVGLAILLQKYKFSLNEKTPVPLELTFANFTRVPKLGILLDVHKITTLEQIGLQ